MKKIAAICIAVIMLLASGCFSDTAKASTTITANITNMLKETSAKNWFSSGSNRATLTVLTACDVFSSGNGFAAEDMMDFLTNSSWVGISKNSRQLMVVGYYGSTTILTIVYTPQTGKIEYTEIKINQSNGSAVPDVLIESMAKKIYDDQSSKYYKNSPSDILEVLSALTE